MNRPLHAAADVALIALGILSAAFGLEGFLLPSGFIDGGVTGVSMLLSQVTDAPLALFIPLINLPFIALGYKQVGRRFALKSAVAIGGLALCLAFLHLPVVTDDKLLTAVFGGFFIGAGIGLAIRGGAVLDGTEVAALLVSKRSALLRVGDVILILNVFIFSAAAFYLGVVPALYSVLTYFSASRTIDFLLHGIEEHTALIIVSERSQEIRQAVIRDLNRGVTVYRGRRGLTDAEQDILLCVVTRLEIGRVRSLVKEHDPAAFVLVHPLSDVHGGMIKKSELHH